MTIDADRKWDAIFVQKRFERNRLHGLVVFKDGMQSKHGEVAAKQLVNAFRLWQAELDAARAQHLERLDDDYLPSQPSQAQGRLGVEPSRHG